MARKKRSEQFYQSRRSQQRSPRVEKDFSDRKKLDRQGRKPDRRARPQKNARRRKRRRRRIAAPYLFIFLLIFVLPFSIYQARAANPKNTLDKAVKAIEEADYVEQGKYFDRLDIINQVLSDSYSDKEEEGQEFVKSNYANLNVDIKNKKKTKNGLEVEVEVTNVNYIDVFDKVRKRNPSNLHKEYMSALSSESEKKSSQTARLIFKRRFSGYKIYESKEFVNAILGGALDYADDIEEN